MSSSTPSQRSGIRPQPSPKLSAAIPTMVFSLLTVAFFAAHQGWSTGFFLPGFGPAEAGLFYGSILYSIVVTNTAVFRIREDRALMLDLIGGVLWTMTTVWLYFIFPFDFAHLAAVVPWPFQFLVSWITNGLAKTIWLLFVLGSAAFIPFFALQLPGVRHRLRG